MGREEKRGLYDELYMAVNYVTYMYMYSVVMVINKPPYCKELYSYLG